MQFACKKAQMRKQNILASVPPVVTQEKRVLNDL
jgi:hypothetical protein